MRTSGLPLGLVFLAACQAFHAQDQEIRVENLPFDTVWKSCLAAANTEFRLDPKETDRGLRTFTTRWYERRRAFRKGRRWRARFQIVPQDPMTHVILFHVQVQRNSEIARPLDPRDEDWENAGQDGDLEARLAYQLRLRLADAASKRRPRPAALPASPSGRDR